MCLDCVHFDRDREDPELPPTCRAYPGGIPNEIWFDGTDHRVPHPGDHGITFAPAHDADMEYIAGWDRKAT